MSIEKRAELVHGIGTAMQALQEASEAFDEAACRKLGLNRTDLKCLGVIAQQGPVSVGEIGRAVKLTRGAATTALDRVERAGYASRIRHPNDRRGVLIEMTAKGRDAAALVWGPMVEDGEKRLAAYKGKALAAILRFLDEARSVRLDHIVD